MSGEPKILTGLMERRAVEAACRELASISRLDELRRRAEEIAAHGPIVVSVLTSLLELPDSQLRGGLGEVAVRLDRDLVVPALRAVALSAQHSDQARIGAVTLLERYLQEPLDAESVPGWQDPDALAVQSLRELEQAMADNPLALLEYLRQLNEQPPETPALLLDAAARLPPSEAVVMLLRTFAQGEDVRLADAALAQLARTRIPAAADALAGLSALLPPPRAALAERGARKLRMSGVVAPAQDPTGERALLSPIDGAGAQLVWLIRPHPTATSATFVGVVIQDPDGIVVSFGGLQTQAAHLPRALEVGQAHLLHPEPRGPALMMLETPAAVGRQVIREGLALNWASGRPTPLEFRVFNAFVNIALAGDDPADPCLEAPAGADLTVDDRAAARLLHHPGFTNWAWQIDDALAVARGLDPIARSQQWEAQVTALAQTQFTAEVIARYTRRLNIMARWLAVAGEPGLAALARRLAADLPNTPPAESPFIRRLIAAGLQEALHASRPGLRLRRSKSSEGA